MATPTLKYVAPLTPEDDLTFAPEPVVIYGVPGGGDSGIRSIVAGTNVTVDDSDPQNPVVSATGGGGGGAVDSVNGETGAVSLSLDDVVSVSGIIEGADKFIGLADDLEALNQLVQVSATQIQIQNIGTSRTVGVSAEGVQVTSASASGTILPPVTGAANQIVLPSASGTLALTSEIPESPADIGAATAAQGALATTAVQPAALASYVPTTRTVAGKALSANVTLAKADVGLGNVDNTADTAKPVSTAQQTALNGKVNALNGVTALWKGTAAQYAALTPDANTVYIVQG